jgi:hypothetical protein
MLSAPDLAHSVGRLGELANRLAAYAARLP